MLLALLTTPVITAAEQAASSLPGIAVIDFTTVELKGHNRYELPTPVPAADALTEQLTAADRQVIDDRWLGLVKALETRTNAWLLRHRQERREKREERAQLRHEVLADRLLFGEQRPVILGADYLIAALARYPEFRVVDRKALAQALLTAPPEETPAAFAARSGVDYLLGATVSDLRTRQRRTRVYGNEVTTTTYSLDLVVQLVDLATGAIRYAGTVTVEQSELGTEFAETRNSDRFSGLLKNAVEQVAAKLHDHFVAGAAKEDRS